MGYGRFRRFIRRARALGAAAFAAVGLAVFLVGCGGSDPEPTPLDVVVANYELVADTDNRFIAGLLTKEQELVSFGEVEMSFSFLGTAEAPQDAEFIEEKTGSFLPIPGSFGGETRAESALTAPSDGAGVFAVEPIRFDRAGFWQVEVTADVDGTTYEGASAFQVLAESQVPAAGQPAIASENYVIGSDAPAAAIDSRAIQGGEVPDIALHSLTIAEALEQDKPLVIVFSTPVFCVSRFCGPITEMVSELQTEYGDEANFIHIEIWQDFQNQTITPTAAEWLYRGNDLHEPWVFLVDASGTITERWDNVVGIDELRSALEAAIAS